MSESTPWILYVSQLGRPVVQDELLKMKLSPHEKLAVERTLKRISVGEPRRGDFDYLGRNIWEARVRLSNRILRMLYFIDKEPKLNVVVLAVIKKTQKTPHAWISLALERKALWESIDLSENSA